ncbi:hypothetical protein Pelo_15410 [Pelomyxa schiedti]|nr:hypothetical protein Pelo_15410 [Pelomyxa schiedti]
MLPSAAAHNDQQVVLAENRPDSTLSQCMLVPLFALFFFFFFSLPSNRNQVKIIACCFSPYFAHHVNITCIYTTYYGEGRTTTPDTPRAELLCRHRVIGVVVLSWILLDPGTF